MKYFKKGRIKTGYGIEGILFKEGINVSDRVFSVSKYKDDIIFTEECDGYFESIFTKEESITMLEELIHIIKNNLL